MSALGRTPWVSAFQRLRALHSEVRSPVEQSALARLAANCLSDKRLGSTVVNASHAHPNACSDVQKTGWSQHLCYQSI
jgi:hypothetical protein